MKVSLSYPVEKLRNKIGAVVFSAGRAGAVVRRWVMPANPQSTAQMSIRNLFKSFTSAWKTIGHSKIVAWNTMAAGLKYIDVLGMSYAPTGKNLFCGWNMVNAISGGVTEIDTPFLPRVPVLGYAKYSALAIASGPGTATLTTDRALGTDSVAWIEATEPLSPGVTNVKGKYKLIKILPKATAAGAQAFGTEYVNIFGTITAGKNVYVRLRTSNDDSTGQVTMSPGFSDYCTTT